MLSGFFFPQQTGTLVLSFSRDEQNYRKKEGMTQAVCVGDAWSEKIHNTFMRRNVCRNVKTFTGDSVA
jgi:hypothetical protein